MITKYVANMIKTTTTTRQRYILRYVMQKNKYKLARPWGRDRHICDVALTTRLKNRTATVKKLEKLPYLGCQASGDFLSSFLAVRCFSSSLVFSVAAPSMSPCSSSRMSGLSRLSVGHSWPFMSLSSSLSDIANSVNW